MDVDEYVRMAAASDQHWWYRSTRELLADVLAPSLAAPVGIAAASGVTANRATNDKRLHILDAAGGTGATSRWLMDSARVTIADIEPAALTVARSLPEAQRAGDMNVILADLNRLPLADASVDGVLCITALYHEWIPDPAAVVAQFARAVRPGGFVCLMEPGVRGLRRGHDAVTHNARRFSRRDLAALLHGAGLEVQRSTGAYSFLVPPAFVLSRLERGEPQSDVGRHSSGLFGLFGMLAGAERALIRRGVNLPFGLSVVALGVRPPAAAHHCRT